MFTLVRSRTVQSVRFSLKGAARSPGRRVIPSYRSAVHHASKLPGGRAAFSSVRTCLQHPRFYSAMTSTDKMNVEGTEERSEETTQGEDIVDKMVAAMDKRNKGKRDIPAVAELLKQCENDISGLGRQGHVAAFLGYRFVKRLSSARYHFEKAYATSSNVRTAAQFFQRGPEGTKQVARAFRDSMALANGGGSFGTKRSHALGLMTMLYYEKMPHRDGAVGLFFQLPSKFGIPYNTKLCNSAIKSCHIDFRTALQIHTNMKRFGIARDDGTYYFLLGACGLCRKAGKGGASAAYVADKLFHEMAEKEGIAPTTKTLGWLIVALGDQFERALNVVDECVERYGVTKDDLIYGSLIGVCSASRSGQLDLALAQYHEMKVAGLIPSTKTYTSLFTCVRKHFQCAEAEGVLEVAFGLYEDMLSFHSNNLSKYAVYSFLHVCRNFAALKRGNTIKRKLCGGDEHPAVSDAASADYEEKVFEVIKTLKKAGGKSPALLPDAHVYETAIECCSNLGPITMHLLKDMRGGGIPYGKKTYESLIQCCDDLTDGLVFLGEIIAMGKKPSMACYSRLIELCLLQANGGQHALQLFEELLGYGYFPPARTYQTLLYSLRDESSSEEVDTVFKLALRRSVANCEFFSVHKETGDFRVKDWNKKNADQFTLQFDESYNTVSVNAALRHLLANSSSFAHPQYENVEGVQLSFRSGSTDPEGLNFNTAQELSEAAQSHLGVVGIPFRFTACNEQDLFVQLSDLPGAKE